MSRAGMSHNLTRCLFGLMYVYVALVDATGNKRHVSVQTTGNLYRTRQDFLSVAISHKALVDNGFDFQSQKLKNLLKSLTPANIRIGGIRSELTIFNAENPDFLLKDTVDEWLPRMEVDQFWDVGVYTYWQNEILTNTTWNAFMKLMHNIHWTVQYGLNYALMNNGTYDTSYAIKFLKYNRDHLGFQVDAVELVNEPNSLGHKWSDRLDISYQELARETIVLKEAMMKAGYGNVKISGPDVTSIAKYFHAVKYLKGFLKDGGKDAVDYIALHHYNLNGKKATMKDMMNRHIMGRIKLLMTRARQITKSVGATKPIILSETACCYSGGSEKYNDKFVAGFMYLDELGLAAQYGIRRVNRQTLFGGWYGMLSYDSYFPRPDFYTSVLFKRLVAGAVWEVKLLPRDYKLRMYANCARRDFYNFPVGSVVVYYLNLNDHAVTLDSGLFKYSLKTFILTPGDHKGLNSTHIALNGKKLEMNGDNLPKMNGRDHKGPIKVPGHSYGFIVVSSANRKGWTCWQMVKSMTKGQDLYEEGIKGGDGSLGEKISDTLLSACIWLGICKEHEE